MNPFPYQSSNPDSDETHLTIQQTKERYGIGSGTLTDWTRNSDMPPVHRHGSDDIGWKLPELKAWEHKHQLWSKIGKVKQKEGRA